MTARRVQAFRSWLRWLREPVSDCDHGREPGVVAEPVTVDELYASVADLLRRIADEHAAALGYGPAGGAARALEPGRSARLLALELRAMVEAVDAGHTLTSSDASTLDEVADLLDELNDDTP